MKDESPLVVVVGETASGKSALAMEIARHFDGELVCADSWTVYKGFDVGTAKPSAQERDEIQHHVLDVTDPELGFNVVAFQRLAKRAIEDITRRNKLPIMVGGTGLYIDSVLYDYRFLPPTSAGVRDELNTLSLPELQQRVQRDGLDVTGIDLRNKRRVIRLIENGGERAGKAAIRPNTLLVGIATDREHLRERVTRRVDVMLSMGLEEEVGRLARQYGWDAEPMRGIGYREWRPYFEPRPGNEQDLEQTRARIISATMSLAKRQRTWFKRNKQIQWLSPMNKQVEVVDLVTTFLST